MIYQSAPNGFVISSHDQWLPGVYADEKAARFAFKFSFEQLQRLQDSLAQLPPRKRLITSEMLKQTRTKS